MYFQSVYYSFFGTLSLEVKINGPVKLATPPSCPPSAATSRAINSASPGKNLSILWR